VSDTNSETRPESRSHPRTAGRPRVVILGAGFGGLAAAKALRRTPVDVVLIDRTNHHLFQPLLYQVATGVLSAGDIALPTRFLLRRQRNVQVLLARVQAVDLTRRLVWFDDGTGELGFDYLIVATGARHAYFGHPEWETLAPGLKTLDDARRIRSDFLLAFERAEKARDAAEREALMTFVIVGAGPTGVELAGMLPTIARRGLRPDYRRVDPAHARVLLLEGGARVLPAFDEGLSNAAHRALQQLGVQVRTNAIVTRIERGYVHVGDERIAARTVFWAAGNQASAPALLRSLDTPLDRAGRVIVDADLSLPAHKNVFVIGDAAAAVANPAANGGNASRTVPALAAAAQQMGCHAARVISGTLTGRRRVPFRYRDKGTMAVIGRRHAIVDAGSLKLTGRLAWLTWLFVHILYLGGFRNRVSVLLAWGYAYLTSRPGARLITEEDCRDVPARDPVVQERPRARAAGQAR
jgi:NADH:ubiquinone reductase (H+-translocating)